MAERMGERPVTAQPARLSKNSAHGIGCHDDQGTPWPAFATDVQPHDIGFRGQLVWLPPEMATASRCRLVGDLAHRIGRVYPPRRENGPLSAVRFQVQSRR